MSRNQSREDSTQSCVVCCEEIEYFAVGQCDHPICHVCCVRMRVLGKENFCAVCRTDLNKVVLTKSCGKWSSIQDELDKGYVDKKLGLCYTSKIVRSMVKELLQHKCTICPDRSPEGNFDQLKDHMKKEHQLFYCTICIQHHRKFTHEWKLYSRIDLATHRRSGDADDKSHKGHPICRFCEDRFLDDDELHRHLRKNHFWCHICEKDGKQLYFMDYRNLREHFRDEHFLCEEDMCKYEQFTSVFRSEIDYQAHRASKHCQKMSKAEVRQARQLEVDLVYYQNPGASGRTITGQDYHEVRSKDNRHKQAKRRGNGNYNRQEETDLKTAIKNSVRNNKKSKTPSPPSSPTVKKQEPKVQLDQKDFPSLSGSTDNSSTQPTLVKTRGRNINSLDDFPSLTNTATLPPQAPPGFKTAPPGFNNAIREANEKTSSFQNKSSQPLPKKSENPYPPLKSENKLMVQEKPQSEPAKQIKTQEVQNTNTQLVNKNTSSRNQTFIENVKILLGNDIEKFSSFKTLSGNFRKGICSAQEYYDNCTSLFEANFTYIFNELVSLLPDSDKQTELLAVHNDSKALAKQNGSQLPSTKSKKPTVHAWGAKPVSQSKTAKPFKEKPKPKQSHEADFPSLPMAAPPQARSMKIYRPTSTQPMKSAWVRGK